MKRFLFTLSKFIFGIGFFIFVLLVLFFLRSPDFTEESIYKKYGDISFYGKNSGKKPRIILVSGSNTIFNFDYETLNRKLYNYDVLGVGMDGTLGLNAILYKLKQLNVVESDVVIFCLAYEFYDPDYFLPLDLFENRMVYSKSSLRHAFQYMPVQTLKSILSISPKRYLDYVLKSKINNKVFKYEIQERSWIWSKDSYSSCQRIKTIDNFSINNAGFDKKYIIDLHQALRKNLKSKIFFRFPAVLEGDTQINQDKIDFIADELYAINKYESTFYGKELWFDRRYHLNKCGAILHTSKFIEEIESILD